MSQHRDHRLNSPAAHSADVNVAIDPVCGMTVNRDTAKHRFSYHGHDYYFCGARSLETSRRLNGELRDYAAWLDAHGREIPLG